MIPDFKTFLRESIWSDIQDRNSGEVIRKEDELKKFYDDLTDMYRCIDNADSINFNDDIISLPLYECLDFVAILEINIRQSIKLNTINHKGLPHWAIPKKQEREQIDNFYKNLEEYFIIEKKISSKYNHWYELKISPKSGKIDYVFCMEVINVILNLVADNKQEYGSKNIFNPCLENNNIYESLWSDIQDKNSREVIRKEDDVNHLNMSDMYDYIYSHYEKLNTQALPLKSHTDENHTFFSIPIFINSMMVYRLSASYKDDKIYKIHLYAADLDCKDFYDEMNQEFTLSERPDHSLIITPKDMSKDVTNNFLLEVIDFICTHAKKPVLKKKINESLWSDIQDRNSGEVARKEDDVDLMDIDSFAKYLSEHYESTDEKWVFMRLRNATQSSLSVCTIDKNIKYTDIDLCLFEDEYGYYTYLFYNNFDADDKQIAVSGGVRQISDELYQTMQKKYLLEDKDVEENIYTVVKPKDGGEITNTFFLDVLDCLLENIPDPLVRKK